MASQPLDPAGVCREKRRPYTFPFLCCLLSAWRSRDTYLAPLPPSLLVYPRPGLPIAALRLLSQKAEQTEPLELWAGAGGEPAGHIPAAWPLVISVLRACAAVLLTFLSLKTAQGRAVPDELSGSILTP